MIRFRILGESRNRIVSFVVVVFAVVVAATNLDNRPLVVLGLVLEFLGYRASNNPIGKQPFDWLARPKHFLRFAIYSPQRSNVVATWMRLAIDPSNVAVGSYRRRPRRRRPRRLVEVLLFASRW